MLVHSGKNRHFAMIVIAMKHSNFYKEYLLLIFEYIRAIRYVYHEIGISKIYLQKLNESGVYINEFGKIVIDIQMFIIILYLLIFSNLF